MKLPEKSCDSCRRPIAESLMNARSSKPLSTSSYNNGGQGWPTVSHTHCTLRDNGWRTMSSQDNNGPQEAPRDAYASHLDT